MNKSQLFFKEGDIPQLRIRQDLFGTVGRNMPAVPPLTLKYFPMAVSDREEETGAPFCTEGRGTRGGTLSTQVEISGCPPTQSHDCSSMSSSRLGGKKGKLMTKVVWGHKGRVKRKRERW